MDGLPCMKLGVPDAVASMSVNITIKSKKHGSPASFRHRQLPRPGGVGASHVSHCSHVLPRSRCHSSHPSCSLLSPLVRIPKATTTRSQRCRYRTRPSQGGRRLGTPTLHRSGITIVGRALRGCWSTRGPRASNRVLPGRRLPRTVARAQGVHARGRASAALPHGEPRASARRSRAPEGECWRACLEQPGEEREDHASLVPMPATGPLGEARLCRQSPHERPGKHGGKEEQAGGSRTISSPQKSVVGNSPFSVRGRHTA